MEELLAYAYLLGEGFELEDRYEAKLNELFLADCENEDLLELEFLSNNIRESIIYIRSHIDDNSFDYGKFGKMLVSLLESVYKNMDIEQFSRRTYAVWESLPDHLLNEEPFFTLCYAEEPLSWGDEKQTRELYERMFSFYDDKKPQLDKRNKG